MNNQLTLRQKADYIESVANVFNKSIKRSLTNLQSSSRDKNEKILREMIDPNVISVERAIQIIYPKN